MKKIAILLSGCGVMDGSEIHEAVTAMLAVEQQGGTYKCFAPEGEQAAVVNHVLKKPSDEKRRMPAEAARIARGDISLLSSYKAADHAALLIPGGMGAVTNLCAFANEGCGCSVNRDVFRAITETHKAGKPIVALCIAPVLVACVLDGVTLTVGRDPETSAAIKQMGCIPEFCNAGQVCVDRKNKVISCPCYMLDKTLRDVALSTSAAVRDMMDLLKG